MILSSINTSYISLKTDVIPSQIAIIFLTRTSRVLVKNSIEMRRRE
uniref:Uncharacterized protein n=1 Tax=Siphoviridae sp. ctGN02 TaxID=2825411 RepID=A0A8S5PIM1_9CAUD|nr:MAG TPA: hypothetical protein [Siphoviridae sp. ctGN02]DAM90793.1 MAG TPA: hypothetical protein [Caudoviricetes sp.]DAX42549.1 MAG TPA: hypothetical protein [Caudoviricetes sp.]